MNNENDVNDVNVVNNVNIPEDQHSGNQNSGIPNSEIPNSEFSDSEIPNSEIPNSEIPNSEIPNNEISNSEIPKSEIPKSEIQNTGSVPIMGNDSAGSMNYGSETGISHDHVPGNNNGPAPAVKPDVKPDDKQKKSHPYLKAVAAALIFGIVGGVTFTLTSMAGLKLMGGSAETGKVSENAAITAPAVSQGVIGKQESAKEQGGTVNAAFSQNAQNEDVVFSVADIAKNCTPSIVSITTKSVKEVRSFFGTYQQEGQSAGSGILIGMNENELIIATNNHVVEGARELTICMNGSEDQVYSAYLKGADASNDLAIIGVDLTDIPDNVRSGITLAVLGDSDSVVVGEQVVAIGNALGYGQSVTSGYVSAMNREVTIEGFTAKLIQTDAAINPGNSGGALFNMRGEVIGINSAKFASSEVEGMGYAIPSNTAKPILNNLEVRAAKTPVDEANQGALGITCMTVDTSAAEAYRIPRGAYITSVLEDSAAEKAGLANGDIITEMEGFEINSADALVNNMSYYAAGEVVTIKYQRMADGGYEEKTVSVTLQKKTEIGAEKSSGNNNYNNGYNNGNNNGRNYGGRSGNDGYYDDEEEYDDYGSATPWEWNWNWGNE